VVQRWPLGYIPELKGAMLSLAKKKHIKKKEKERKNAENAQKNAKNVPYTGKKCAWDFCVFGPSCHAQNFFC
jgi:hypothetical protein